MNCWGEFRIPPETWAHWKIGPAELFGRSSAGEWRFAFRSEGDPLDEEVIVNIPSEIDPEPKNYQWRRYTLKQAGPGIRIQPRLADQAVVIRPETPLFLLAGEKTTLYVSTPVWMAVSLLDAAPTILFETPVFRPSDTWFGPNTREGELCYASLSSARTSVGQLTHLVHRAITPIEISNRSKTAFSVEQLRLPVPALSLYESDTGLLWTESVVFERSEDELAASFRIREEGTDSGDETKRVAEPRSPLPRKTVVEAVSRLFQ